MSAITLDLPDDLAERLRAAADRLPRILELGLRELDAFSQRGFSSTSDSCFAILDGSQLDSFVDQVAIAGSAKLPLTLLTAQRRGAAEPGRGAASDKRA
jgi:hypothetical protein